MLKQIFQNRNFNSLKLFNYSWSSNTYIGMILKNNRHIAINNIHTSISNAKVILNHENLFAFDIINKNTPNINYQPGGIDLEVTNEEEFNNLLQENWRKSSAKEIVEAFKKTKNYCVRHNIKLSDTRFDGLVDGLVDHCEKLSDSDILDLLNYISECPLCDSYDAHNYHDIWSCLDDICCWKVVDWDVEKSLTVANIWYKLHLGKLSDFVFILIDRLSKKADRLTKEQLVNILFYFNVCRKRAVDFEYEYALEKHINDMNLDELAVIAMGYFKTQTKIKLLPILEAMVQKVSENSTNIHEIALTAILKIIRLSKPAMIIPQIHSMLDKLTDEIPRLSELCCLHIALIGTGLQAFHKLTVQKVSEKFVASIADNEKIRLKDIERILNVLSMFDYDPRTEPDIFQACYLQLHENSRLKEQVKYPRCLTSALNFLSLRGIYSYELMDKILDGEYVAETYGKNAKMLGRDLFSLDCSIDIECPDYKGNRLTPHLRYKGAKWLTEFTPSYDQYKKITAADRLILDTIDTVKIIVGDENLIHIQHVLPHFSRADIILCKDKRTNKYIEPPGFQNYILGDVMYPFNDGNLQWFAIVIAGWNNTIRDSSLLLGNMLMKKRHLNKIGYKPVFVVWNEFLRLPAKGRVDYVSRQLC